MLCDVMIKTDVGTIVIGHNIVLVSSSSYFCALFSRYDEQDRYLLKISKIYSITSQLLVDYIYTDNR